jgi:hypothetical protein
MLFAERVEDILREVGMKRKLITPMLNNLNEKYRAMLEGLDDMEKALRIEQEQANIMTMMKKASVIFSYLYNIDITIRSRRRIT